MDDIRQYLRLTPAKIAVLYAAFGLVWITTSDLVVAHLWSSAETISTIQTFKGGIFVSLSATAIWGLARKRETQLQASQERIENISVQLQVLQRVFRHNIRNELTIIHGYIEMARTSDREAHLDRAKESARQVIDISEKIKIVDKYPISTEIDGAVDVVDLLETELTRIHEGDPPFSLEVDLPDRAPIRGDDSIGYVFHELLQNAETHFDAPPEELEVHIEGTMQGSKMEIRVIDNGPGIPEYELEALEKGHETSLIHLSSVGLWVVQWLMERVNGDIEFEAPDEGGTTVTLEFQKARPGDTIHVYEGPIVEDFASFSR